MSLARRFLALQLAMVVVISLVVALVMIQQTRAWVTSRAESVTRAATSVIADDPSVREALASDDPHGALQPHTLRLEADSDIDFVTVMTPDGIRLTHPIPEFIGKPYSGDRSRALAGQIFTSTEAGQLGPSVRTIAPVRDADGSVIGLVSTGVLLDHLARENRQQLPGLALIVLALLVMSSLVSLLLARYLNRVTGGRAPEALARAQALNDAVLAEAREGLVLLDEQDRPVLVNARGRQLLGMVGEPPPAPGRRRPLGRGGRGQPSRAVLPRPVREVLGRHRVFADEWCTVGARSLIVSCAEASRDARLRVLIVQDYTELTALSGELDTVRTMAAGLRAQTHEHANRLHTVVSLLELEKYPQALAFASSNLSVTRQLGATVSEAVADPYLSALLLAKTALAHERGVRLDVSVAGAVPPLAVDPSELVSVIGNLVDNAIDAASSGAVPEEEPTVEIEFAPSEREGFVRFTVADNGPGVAPAVMATLFDRGVSTKPGGEAPRGVGLHLSRRITRSWGTDLRFFNDAGAVFTGEIPARAEPAGAPEATS